MRRRFSLMAVLLGVATLVAVTAANTARDPGPARDPQALTVHEWGTFTSVAGADGRPVLWHTVYGQSDLPCFVRRARRGPKDSLEAFVRMETPVLYFYSPRDTTVDVSVRFRRGAITEWFPDAVVQPEEVTTEALARSSFEGSAQWRAVKVLPGAKPDFRTEPGASHYYAARETDAAPIRVGAQTEKYLFYRGVANFTPPVEATISAGDKVLVRNPEGAKLGSIVFFENLRGTKTYEARDVAASEATFSRRAVAGRAPVSQAVEKILIGHGLYPKEAAAMVATWRDSWFEEGARLFYIMPSRSVDQILPLTMTPKPESVTRVFVGRMELVTAERLQEFRDAILKNDIPTLKKHGRFFPALLSRLLAESSPADRAALNARLPYIYGAWGYQSSGCR